MLEIKKQIEEIERRKVWEQEQYKKSLTDAEN